MTGVGPSSDNFIKDAIKRPGALMTKAKSAGKSVMAFASKNKKGSSTTAKQSRFAEFLNRVRPGKK